VLWLSESPTTVQQKTTPWIVRDASKSVHAAFLYANACKDGSSPGTGQDITAAHQWYTWAAERGHLYSQYVLALFLLKQQGGTLYESHPNVIQLLQQAAHGGGSSSNDAIDTTISGGGGGLALAQHELGTYYKQGYCGLTCNWNMARKYFQLAQNQGHVESAEILNDPLRWQSTTTTADHDGNGEKVTVR
jgi:TPR repeat protein